jgi:hypothetical protein
MNTLILSRAGWLIIGLSVLLPLLPAAAEQPQSQTEKLEWLLATHDVRYAIHVPRLKSASGVRSETGRDR